MFYFIDTPFAHETAQSFYEILAQIMPSCNGQKLLYEKSLLCLCKNYEGINWHKKDVIKEFNDKSAYNFNFVRGCNFKARGIS